MTCWTHFKVPIELGTALRQLSPCRVEDDMHLVMDQGKGVILVVLDRSWHLDSTTGKALWGNWVSQAVDYVVPRGPQANGYYQGKPLCSHQCERGGATGLRSWATPVFCISHPSSSIVENQEIGHHRYADDRQLYTTFSPKEPGSLHVGFPSPY